MTEVVQEYYDRVKFLRFVFVCHHTDVTLRVNHASLVHGQNLYQALHDPSSCVSDVSDWYLADDNDVVQMMLEMLFSCLAKNFI